MGSPGSRWGHQAVEGLAGAGVWPLVDWADWVQFASGSHCLQKCLTAVNYSEVRYYCPPRTILQRS